MKEYTIFELQKGLNDGEWTSVDLIDIYLERINCYDSSLNSIGEINPDAYYLATECDLRRKAKSKKGLLDGIPLVIKDNINTADKMHTTAGSLALADLYAPYDATVVSQLRTAGAVILGKANLSEFAYFMSDYSMPSGFGSRFGQVKSPYHQKIDPLGSSTGSAVSVAANLIPVSLGTETNGSLMAPAQQNSIVAVKPTLGLISRYGVIPISFNQDTVGPMGRTVEDCAVLLDVLWGKDEKDPATLTNPKAEYHFVSALKMPINGMRVGLLTFSNVTYDEEEKSILQDAAAKLASAGIEILDAETFYQRINNYRSLLYEFKVSINHYLSTVQKTTRIRSLADIIAFNQRSPYCRMPYGQTVFVAAERTTGTLTEAEYLTVRKEILGAAGEIDRLLDKYNLDALICPRRTSYAPINGNPCICV
ncbi:MAG: amidase family protein, partial [Bacilli bacterium]|nr:amidase family protein [Bacilli bacterium]